MRRLILLFVCCLITLPAWSARITGGPMPGHATSRTATVWLQADAPGKAQIEYWPERNPQQRALSLPAHLDPASDYTAHIEVTDLKPGTRYRYAVLLDDRRVLADENLVLATLPAWKWNTAAPDFTAYLGSCAFINDPDWDRPGKAYGGDYGIFDTLARAAGEDHQPNFMLWLGDNVYFRETDHASPWAMNARYRHSRSLADLQALLRATRHYAVWDDHDYGPNNANRGFVFKDHSLALFRRYWANPGQGLADLPGNFTQFGFLDADFFLLDDRFYRASDTTQEPIQEVNWFDEFRDWAIGSNQLTRLLGRRYLSSAPGWLGENKVMFGAAQLDWLKQGLINSTATFKVVVSGSQLFNDAGTGEGWQNFKGERENFVLWLTQQKITGVVFLSGDRHHTELIRRERKKSYPLYELTCSPLTAGAGIPDREKDNPQRVEGTLVSQRNFCTLDFIGPPHERQIRIRSYGADGMPFWERSLSAAELAENPEESVEP